MSTKLLYMTRGELREYATQAEAVQGRTLAILPETIFYPQGGGQPCDTGEIRGPHGVFTVSEVHNLDGVVSHIGLLEGELAPGDPVTCVVNGERRDLNSRLHSAGHVLDMAVRQAGFGWTPGKGYSFPDGPYVEYSGDITTVDAQEAAARIDLLCAELIGQDLPVTVEFMSLSEMRERLPFVPSHAPEKARVVFMGEYGIPCGGTHVRTLQEIGSMRVRKVKRSGEVLRVSYEVLQTSARPNFLYDGHAHS